MTIASRDAFLGANKRRFRDVVLPVSGLTVRVRSLTEWELSEFQQANYDKNGNRLKGRLVDSKARLITLSTVNESGEPLFLPGDEQAILDIDSADTTYLWDQIWEHLGGAKPIEETAKN